MPETKIHPQKIKSFNMLLNSIDDEHPELKIPKYALLIGAGCSLQCGIPLGSDIISLCKMHAFLREEVPNSKQIIDSCRTNKNEIEQKIKDLDKERDYQEFIKKKEKFITDQILVDKEFHLKRLKDYLKIDGDGKHDDKLWKDYFEFIKSDYSYGFWMNQYSEDSETRQRLIEEIMDDRQPDGAYIILAYLIEKRRFTNILTTNFDDLINEAVMYYTEQRCRFYVDDELSQYISIHNKKPNIVKLHGDYRFANMKNTIEETDRLTNNIGVKLRELLRHLGLIMVGYNGADYSIMSVLQEFKNQYKYPLIWCGMNPNKVHWRVAHLINNTENSFFVEIKGFDWFMGQLAINFLTNVPDIEAKAKIKKQAVDRFLKQFKISFEESGGSPDEVEKLDETMSKWDMLKKAEANKDYDAIIKLETEIIESSKGNEIDYAWRGWAYNELKRHELALQDYDKAIELDDKFVSAYNNRGTVYHELKKYELALRDYDKAIELNDKYAITYNNRGNTYRDLKKYELALQDYNKAIEFDDKYVKSYRNRGNVYYTLKKYELALQDYDKAIELDDKYAGAYNNRGVTYHELKKYELALQDYDKAIEQDNKYASAYNNRGFTYHELKKYELALRDYDKAIEQDNKYASAYNNRGFTYHELRRYELALGDYDKAIELDDKHASAYNNRGFTYRELKKYELALQDFDKAIELDDKYADAYNSRGYTYQELKKYELALQDYDMVIELDDKYDGAYNNRGYTYQELKKYELALQDFDKAIELDGKDAISYNNRGYAYLELKKYELALQDFNKSVQLDSESPNPYKHRGVVYFKQKKYDDAIADLNKAIELKPEYSEAYQARAELFEELGEKNKAKTDRKKVAELKAHGK